MLFKDQSGRNGVAYSKDIDGLNKFIKDGTIVEYNLEGFNGHSWEIIQKKQ